MKQSNHRWIWHLSVLQAQRRECLLPSLGECYGRKRTHTWFRCGGDSDRDNGTGDTTQVRKTPADALGQHLQAVQMYSADRVLDTAETWVRQNRIGWETNREHVLDGLKCFFFKFCIAPPHPLKFFPAFRKYQIWKCKLPTSFLLNVVVWVQDVPTVLQYLVPSWWCCYGGLWSLLVPSNLWSEIGIDET